MILDIYKKYREIINYIIFGGLTTLVNFVIYFFFIEVFRIHYIYSNIVAWFISVLFAYITNRLYVFEKVNTKLESIIREVVMFFGSRLFSGVVETLLLYIMVDISGLSTKYSKIFVAVVVVILNYVFSKMIVFKKYN